MQTIAPDSLLTETSFLAELASLDEGMTVKRRSPLPAVEQRAYEPFPELPVPVRASPPGMFADEPLAAADVEDGPSALGQLAAAVMFVLMMAVGAAGAAVVFHEQVARILAVW
jgi:hypothetical protein